MGFFDGLVDFFDNHPKIIQAGLTGAGVLTHLLSGSGSDSSLTDEQKNLINSVISGGNSNVADARKTLQQPLDYWSKILSGDRNAAVSSLSPEINTITSQYDTALKSINELSPRGGGRNSTMQDLTFKKAGDVSRLVDGARPTAAGAVTDIGSRIGNLGTTQLQIGSGSLSSGIAANQGQQKIDAASAGDLGSSLGTLIGILTNKNKGTSGAQQDPFWASRTTPGFNPNSAGIGWGI